MADFISVSSGVPTTTDLDAAFADFLLLDVANGDASEDTIRGYRAQVGQGTNWCRSLGVDPTAATLAYHYYSRCLRAVQEMLSHADPITTSKYARVFDRAKYNPALSVPVNV